MQTAFICSKCECDLTDFLTEESSAALACEINVDMVAPGRCIRVVATMTMRDFYGGGMVGSASDEILAQPGDYLLNIADLRHQMHPDAEFGCCGYAGGVGPNACCLNGHLIATIHADCWQPTVARLKAELVKRVTLQTSDSQIEGSTSNTVDGDHRNGANHKFHSSIADSRTGEP